MADSELNNQRLSGQQIHDSNALDNQTNELIQLKKSLTKEANDSKTQEKETNPIPHSSAFINQDIPTPRSSTKKDKVSIDDSNQHSLNCDLNQNGTNPQLIKNQTDLKINNNSNITSQKEMINTAEDINSANAYIKMLTDDIHKKERVIKSLSSTNSVLRQNLLKFSDIVEALCQKKVTKSYQLTKKQATTSLEMDLQLKEKELRNHIAIIDNYSKENKMLKKKLETFGDYDYKIELNNQIKAQAKEYEQLMKENKMLKKLLDEHNNCIKEKDEMEIIIQSLRKDIVKEKEKFVELKSNHRLLESKFNSLQTSKDNIIERDIKPNSSTHLRLMRTQLCQKKKEETLCNMSQEPSIKEIFNSNKMMVIFDDEEKGILEGLFKAKPEKKRLFLKKIQIIESYRTSNDHMQKNQLKKTQEEVEEKKEEIIVLSTKWKETEIKMKILSFQSNDLKQSNKAYQKKIIDLQHTIDGLNARIKEKEKERVYATKEIELFQKLYYESHNNDLDDGVKNEILKIQNDKNISIPNIN